MTLRLLAASGALLIAAACLCMIVALVGTRKPVGPAGPTARGFRRLWHGRGRTARQRARHRATLILAIGAGVLTWLFTGLPVVGLLVLIAVAGAPALFQLGREEREASAHV